jgi:hypothetical protein
MHLDHPKQFFGNETAKDEPPPTQVDFVSKVAQISLLKAELQRLKQNL